MSDLHKTELLSGVKNVNDTRHLDIHEQLRRRLEEGNIAEYWKIVDVTTPSSANTEFMVDCTPLNRTPVYYWILDKDRGVDVYRDENATPSSKNKLYVKATVANAVIKLAVVA